MNYQNLYNDVAEEFPHNIALGVCIASGIHLSTTIKDKDIDEEGRYTKRVTKKIIKALWEYSAEEMKTIMAIWNVVHDFYTRKTLEGLGGCEIKTFKELIGEIK